MTNGFTGVYGSIEIVTGYEPWKRFARMNCIIGPRRIPMKLPENTAKTLHSYNFCVIAASDLTQENRRFQLFF